MAKKPSMTRQNTRYEPYHGALRGHRQRGSPPPNNPGNQARTHHDQLNNSIYEFLENLYTHYSGHNLLELFREHARQTGALGRAIETWLQYNDVSSLLLLYDLPQTDMQLANR